MKEIKLTVPEGYEAKWVDNILTLVEEKDEDVRNRIKTLEDAVDELSISENKLKLINSLPTHISAQLKLEIIIHALNERWIPDMSNFDEKKYYPYFSIVKDKYKTEQSDSNGRSGNGATCGLAYSYSNYAWTSSTPTLGARLALKNSELAEYAGRQFIELYEEALLR